MVTKNQMSNFPTPSVGGLSVYLAQIKKFPMLDAEEEYLLARIGERMEVYSLLTNWSQVT